MKPYDIYLTVYALARLGQDIGGWMNANMNRTTDDRIAAAMAVNDGVEKRDPKGAAEFADALKILAKTA